MFDSEKKSEEYFESLRMQAHVILEEELRQRKTKNPQPSDEELIIGAYLEEIEPQVRDAVRIFNEKGYSTDSSGFYKNGSVQAIDGDFKLDQKSVENLRKMGCAYKAITPTYSMISFPVHLDDNLETLKLKWLKIAEALPTMGPALPADNAGAEDFRLKFDENRVKKVLAARVAAVKSKTL